MNSHWKILWIRRQSICNFQQPHLWHPALYTFKEEIF